MSVLSLRFVELVDLVSHLVGHILLFLAESSDLSLASQSLLLQVATQFQQLLFSLLVEVDLEETE